MAIACGRVGKLLGKTSFFCVFKPKNSKIQILSFQDLFFVQFYTDHKFEFHVLIVVCEFCYNF